MIFKAIVLTIVTLCITTTTGWSQDEAGLPVAVTTQREMVVTANPLATEAGELVLRLGGTATDAMIAVQTVLGLVEPQSSGLGGGAFIVYYDAKRGRTTTIDAREKAPSTATENRFLDEKDESIGFFNAWQSGLSVGVPGVPRMMEYMHDRYGRLPWQLLFIPARVLARKGFELTERTSSQVAGLLNRNDSCEDGERLFFRDPVAFDYFVNTEDCTAKPAGTKMRNKPYAKTLGKLSRRGAEAFYTGRIARDIAGAVQGDLNIPGDMAKEDLANYDVVEREPVCIDYLGFNVCGMGPPSSGGIAVGQILGIIQNRPELMGTSPLDPDTVHLFAQAGRLTFADRGKYVADSDFITVPVEGLLEPGYLQKRAEMISEVDMGPAEPGIPPGEFDPASPDNSAKSSGTSHVSIIDRYGNALSMTTTIESSFGNGVMVHGFLLNNELTDFSFAFQDSGGTPIANRVQPNKRPRSSMSPTIVFDDKGKVELVTGSPGGSRIIGYTAQSIMNVLAFGLDPQEAINVPHYMNRNGPTDLETPIPGVTLDYDADALAAELIARDHPVRILTQTSGLSTIQVVEREDQYDDENDDENDDDDERKKKGRKRERHRDTFLMGGADQRRDGAIGGR